MVKKTYSDHMKNLSKDDVFHGLLGFGLFPDKLPPFLSSASFLDFCLTKLDKFFDKYEFGFIHYENTRNINIPRVLSIPNPIAYRNQCFQISENWDNLITHFDKNTQNDKHKISRIHIRKIQEENKIFYFGYDEEERQESSYDTIFEMSHKNYKLDDYPEPDLLIGSYLIVYADISNCFPSIYTHAIPWALVGKEQAKVSKSDNKQWYNKLDLSTRNLKNGETHGILIGPHSSNIISEIVLTRVDAALSKEEYKYIRSIDDYRCFVRSHEEGEKFLLSLSVELKKFGLILNNKKTEILKLPMAASEHWIRKINSFMPVREKSQLNFNELRTFLDISLELMKLNNDNSAILKYAMKMLIGKKLNNISKSYYEKTIHHLVLIYPYLVVLIDDLLFQPFKTSINEIEKFTQNLFLLGVNKNNNEVVSYALFFALKYNFKIKELDDIYNVAIKTEDCIVMLLSYLHHAKNETMRKARKKYLPIAEKYIDHMDSHWLFAYEVLPITKLKNYWKTMKEAKVSFVLDHYRSN